MNLRRRLAKLEGEIRPVSAKPTYDLRLLHPEDVDFICQFADRPPDDQEYLDNLPVIEGLLRECEVEPVEHYPVILPEFPCKLQTYWRRQRFVNKDFELPRGNYDCSALTYAAQAQLQALCERYGWDPDAGEINIEPLSRWADDHLEVLYDLLEAAVLETEKAIWLHKCDRTA